MNGNIKVALLSAACLLAAGAAQAQEKITLRIADYLPPNHLIYSSGLKPFMDEVKKATNGRVEFQYFPGEQLGKAKDLISLVQSGAVDMAQVLPSYASEKIPLMTISELPGLYTTSCQGTRAFMAASKPDGALGKAFKAAGTRAVIAFMYQPADLLVAKGDVTTVEAWKGLKVRTAGGPTELAVVEMGGVPVKMAATDLFQSLSRGTVDAALLVSTSAKSYGLDNVVKSITTGFSLGSIASTYLINAATWEKLPPDIQAAIEKAGAAAGMSVCDTLDTKEKSELDRMKGMGIAINRLSDAERKAWTGKVSGLIGQWATRIKVPEAQVKDIFTALQPAD